MRTITSMLTIMLMSLTASASPPAQLKDVAIAGSHHKGVRNCKGGSATISGNANKLTLKNCKTVTVDGNQNKLVLVGTKTLSVRGNRNHVNAGVVKSISTMGNRNTVVYKVGRNKKKPKISNLGTGNTIRRKK